jgi:hypothetical protein
MRDTLDEYMYAVLVGSAEGTSNQDLLAAFGDDARKYLEFVGIDPSTVALNPTDRICDITAPEVRNVRIFYCHVPSQSPNSPPRALEQSAWAVENSKITEDMRVIRGSGQFSLQLEEERDENGEIINRGGFFMADIHDWPLPPNFQSDR